ncbi:MAG: LamG-like jellyroll fold domain-containing protein [Bacteroidota bacterium]|nr:LamG-like jellyroll fold domain-containing protein [Bacteroidota bacterium]
MKMLLATITLTILSFTSFAQGASNAFRFDGNDDAVEVGTVDFNFQDQFTVMGWMKWNIDPKEGDNWANVVTINKESSSDQGQFWLQHDRNNKKLEFALELENGRQFIWSNTQMAEGEWIHFAGTYDGSVMRFYINGIEEGHKNRSGNIRSFESDFTTTIGNWAAYGGGRYFNGDVDEISIWNRALNQDEIRDFMTETLNVNETGLLSYYQFNELSSNVLEDLTGSYPGNVNGTSVVTSTAPVGDVSVSTYGGNDLSLISEDNLVMVSDFDGNPDGVHIYKVNVAPSSVETENLDINEVVGTEYFGVFIIGNRESTFRYTKKLNSEIDVTINDSLGLAYRDDSNNVWRIQDIYRNFADSIAFFYTEGGFAQRQFVLIKADPSLLPIELLSFDVYSFESEVTIEWSTASETNNDYFTIQRSEDGQKWEDIAQVVGAGNSTTERYYEYTDYSPLNGTSYYRLKQTDFDGRYETFDMLSVSFESNNEIELDVYPNPVVNTLNISHNSSSSLHIMLMNNAGQVITSFDTNGYTSSVEMSNFPKGTYILKVVTADESVITKKVIKQ